MDKKYEIIIFLIIVFNSSLFAQENNNDSKFPPAYKSAILPGWGQYDLNRSKRGNFYITTEIVGVALTTLSFVKSKNLEDTYIAMAVEHAGATDGGKDHQFWVDIGNYDSREDFNDEHLRWREFDVLYPDDELWDWEWDSENNREEFEDSRIKSDNFKLIGKFFIGGIVLNHIISAIDAYYLQNISLKENIAVFSYYYPNLRSLQYSIQINL